MNQPTSLGRLLGASLLGFFVLVATVVGLSFLAIQLAKTGLFSWIPEGFAVSAIMVAGFGAAMLVVAIVFGGGPKQSLPPLPARADDAPAAGPAAAEAKEAAAPPPATDDLVSPQAFRLALGMPQGAFDSSALLLVSMLLFGGLELGSSSVSEIAVLVGVILFHELGHFAAMKAFGYSDVKIFFLPLFGAATSGRREGAPGWQKALVSLMGPAPGLVLGAVLAGSDGLVGVAGRQMLVLNAFNLLPFEPLDGGHFLHAVVFSRWRRLELLFAALGLLSLAALSWAGQMWILLGVSLLGLLGLSARSAQIQRAEGLRARWPQWPERLAEASDEMLRDALGVGRDGYEREADAGKRALRAVGVVRALHERVLLRAPGAAAAVGLLFAYGALWFVTLLGVLLMALRSSHPS